MWPTTNKKVITQRIEASGSIMVERCRLPHTVILRLLTQRSTNSVQREGTHKAAMADQGPSTKPQRKQ